MNTKSRILIMVGILAVFDTVIPIPFTALIVIYAILEKPRWATELIRDVWAEND